MIAASVANEMMLDGPCDALGEAASVDVVLDDGPCDVLGDGSMSPFVTNFSIDPVMTRNPS